MFICIFTNPHSGSSMVASIFRAHGVWTGKSMGEYETYEWPELKKAIKHQGPPYNGAFITKATDMPMVNKLIEEKIDQGIDFLHKSAPELYGVLKKWQPKIIKIRRNIKSIIAGQNVEGQYIDLVYKRHALLEQLDGPWVDTDEIMDDNFDLLKEAFDYCSLNFNIDLAKSRINKDLWHQPKHVEVV